MFEYFFKIAFEYIFDFLRRRYSNRHTSSKPQNLPQPTSNGKQKNTSIQTTNTEKFHHISDTGLAIANRFIRLFEGVGAQKNDIAEIFNLDQDFRIDYNDLSHPEKLCKKLTPQLLNWCSNQFGVSKDWLANASLPIYHPIIFHHNIHEFIRYLKILKHHYEEVHIFTISNAFELNQKNFNPKIGFLISIPTGIYINSRPLTRYIPVRSEPWNDQFVRNEIKTIFWLCENLEISLSGKVISKENELDLTHGLLFPEEVLWTPKCLGSWYPHEHYISPDSFCSSEVTRQDRKEFESFLQFFENGQYHHLVKLEYEKKEFPKDAFSQAQKITGIIDYIKQHECSELDSKIKRYFNPPICNVLPPICSDFEEEKLRSMLTIFHKLGYHRISCPYELKALLEHIYYENRLGVVEKKDLWSDSSDEKTQRTQIRTRPSKS